MDVLYISLRVHTKAWNPNVMWTQEPPFLSSAKSSKLCISIRKSDCSCSWKSIVQTEVEPGPESSDALELKLCSRGYRRAVQNKPLMQTQSSCGIEPPNSWSASLEPWPASFHYLVSGGADTARRIRE